LACIIIKRISTECREAPTHHEALALATTRLNHHATDTRRFHILQERTLEKSFGWVFFYEIVTSANGNTSEPAQVIRPVIVNKHSQQVIGNSLDQPIETTIKLYEKLLADSKAIAEGWCLTLNPRDRKTSAFKKLAEKTKKAGFYEIS
jgi:hypothetical protein